MRVNVYEEELTADVQITETSPDETHTFYGVRVFLHSSERLHNTPTDDDRSAVTFWVGERNRAVILRDALVRALKIPFGD